MSQYFIKRGEKIHGPFSTKQVKSGLESGKLKDADLISASKEGPWQTVTEQFQEPAPVVEVISEDLPTGEDSFFENVEIPAVATPVAQFPTPTKKNEGESTEEGEDTNNNEDNSSLVVCPDCNKQVSKRAASCPHCGAPLKAFNVDDAKVKAKAMFGVLKQKAESLKEKAEANPNIAGAMSKAKEVAKDAVEQASELKKSTSQQLEEGGAKEAGKHVAASLASPKYRVLACVVVAGVLLLAYLTFSGSSDPQGPSSPSAVTSATATAAKRPHRPDHALLGHWKTEGGTHFYIRKGGEGFIFQKRWDNGELSEGGSSYKLDKVNPDEGTLRLRLYDDEDGRTQWRQTITFDRERMTWTSDDSVWTNTFYWVDDKTSY